MLYHLVLRGELATAVAGEIATTIPLFEDGSDGTGMERTAALVVAVAFRESSFRNDVSSSTGDHCMMQVHGRPDLKKDVRACVRTAIEMMRESIRRCGSDDALAFYAEGTCRSTPAQRTALNPTSLSTRILPTAQKDGKIERCIRPTSLLLCAAGCNPNGNMRGPTRRRSRWTARASSPSRLVGRGMGQSPIEESP